jgi:hypothetical protein
MIPLPRIRPVGFLTLLLAACGSGGPTIQTSGITLEVNSNGTSATVIKGSAAPGDSVSVTLAGPNSDVAYWVVAKKSTWLILGNINGKGSGPLHWTRETLGLDVGTYVDTITITLVGSPNTFAKVYDTLHIAAPPPPSGPFAITPHEVVAGGTVTVTSNDFRIRGTTVTLQFDDTTVPMTRIGETQFTAQVPLTVSGTIVPRLQLDEFTIVLDAITVLPAGLRNR